MLLKLDLQRFADGEDDSLDLDSMLAEFESEWTEDEVEDSNEPDQSDEVADDEALEEEQEETETPNPNDDDAEKRNRAFADLRRQAEENRKYADFINTLAQEGGVTPDEILARYQERQLTAKAQAEGIPVEHLKRQTETESRLEQLENQIRAERMNTQIESVVDKYQATDDAIRETFEYMAQTGIDPRTADNVDFEKFYRAAHLDTIIKKEVEAAKQKDLAHKKERQTNASIGNGTSVSPSSGELSDEEFDAELARLGIRL